MDALCMGQLVSLSCNQGITLCLGAFRTSVERLHIDTHKPCLGVDVQSYLCSMLPRSNYSLNITHMTRGLM